MRKFILPLLCLGLLASCAGNSDSENQQSSDVNVKDEIILVDTASSLMQRFVVERVEEDTISRVLTTTGVVSAIPNDYAEVAAPFSGRIVKTLVHIGQKVVKGTPLFEISSSDYSEVIKNYHQSSSNLRLAKKALDRVRDLRDNKVASDKDLDEAQSAYDQALEELNHAKAVAHEFQIDLSHAVVGQPMVVRSPVAGKVLSCNLVVGEYLKDDSEAKVIVADLAKVWVKANVYEKDVNLIEGVSDVSVRLVSSPDNPIHGHICYVGGILDPETRTMQTLIECQNPQSKMLPNMYATVEMKTSAIRCIVVPKSAVLQAEGYQYVLVQQSPGAYRRAKVSVESADADRYVVTEGLSQEDQVITQGAYFLVDAK